jgi:hypothetical protein
VGINLTIIVVDIDNKYHKAVIDLTDNSDTKLGWLFESNTDVFNRYVMWQGRRVYAVIYNRYSPIDSFKQ